MKTAAPHLQTERAALCSELGAGVPEWVEVLPPGPVIVGRDGRRWSYDAADVLRNTLAHSQGAELPFDYLHATELQAPQGNDAPAAGWALEYRVSERGAIEARVDWTSRAANSISAREYRYVSPVFLHDDDGRIARFSSFGLTNKPNLTLKALNSETTPENHPMELAEAIRAALGLPENATEQDAVAAINALKEAQVVALNSERSPSLDKYVPRADYDGLMKRAENAEQQLQAHKKSELQTAINAEIEAALTAGKITPATRAYHVAQCQQEGGLERFREFVKAAPSVTEAVLPNKLPEQQDTALNAEQQTVARWLGMSDEQFKKHIEGVN
ncbi:Mu phage protease GpI [Metapseudomonas otitidis]|uniref:Mu phage protease GpI n=1 Tax=Metapseudomonas otitidis TaxID=319939 RepID=A0A6S5RXM5_9GAMM|nr:phage protease [Pseudomonas otitidis]BBT16999.1 Mu phage protease GpI [Pseudomonas otitidis]